MQKREVQMDEAQVPMLLDYAIKPCPFCGHMEPVMQARLHKFRDEAFDYYVQCSAQHGGCGASGGAARDRNRAINKWNDRG